MSGAGRLVVTFHGIGEPGRDVPADEVGYWCPEAEWPPLVEALAGVRDAGNVELQITFDDGNRSDVDLALPVLQGWGFTATFHVCAGRLGRPGYVDGADLTRLRAAGMAIGSHGWDHVDLRAVDDVTLRRETQASRTTLAEASGGVVDEFAVPFGSYDRRVLGLLRDYRVVYTSDGGRADATGRPTPRTSYVRGWKPETIRQLAGQRPSAPERLARRAWRAVKALR